MKKAIVAVFLTTAMAVSTACGTVSSTPSTDNAASGSELPQESPLEESTETVVEGAVEYSADDILDMLDKNPLNASRTLKDSVIYLTGTLNEIDASGEYIGIKGKEEYGTNTIKCYVSTDEQLDYIAGLSKNDGVRVLGKVTEVDGNNGYKIIIEDIEEYLLYPRLTVDDSNWDYSEYEKYTFKDETTIWAPIKWKEYLDEDFSENGFYFYFGNDNDYQSKGLPGYCMIAITSYDDETFSSLAENGLSLEDDKSKFEALAYGESEIKKQLEQLAQDADEVLTEDFMESSYLLLNNNPTLSILLAPESEEGFLKMFTMYMENKAVSISAVYPTRDQIDSNELLEILLSVDQDIPQD